MPTTTFTFLLARFPWPDVPVSRGRARGPGACVDGGSVGRLEVDGTSAAPWRVANDVGVPGGVADVRRDVESVPAGRPAVLPTVRRLFVMIGVHVGAGKSCEGLCLSGNVFGVVAVGPVTGDGQGRLGSGNKKERLRTVSQPFGKQTR